MHSFKYAFKTLFRKKTLIFWTYAFPIILGLLFNFAFAGIEDGEKLKVFDIAIINNENFNNNEYYKSAFKSLSTDDNKLFNINYVNDEEAENLLKDKKIVGYILFDEEVKVVVNSNGINETVIKQVTDEIIESEYLFNNVIELKTNEIMNDGSNYEELNVFITKIYDEVISENNKSYVKDISLGNLSYTNVEFYTLIAMACLYGALLGVTALNQNLPNMSSNGKRVAVSNTPKSKLILTSLLASYLVQLIGVALLFLFTIFVLKIDYGNNLGLIILLALAGSFAGLSLGIFVATIFKVNENTKIGIVIALTMLWCFLSGMMGITLKYKIDKNIPILNKINPANMITDGFYSLYYYDTLNRYIFDLVSLLIFSVLLITISIFSIRRQKYDSI